LTSHSGGRIVPFIDISIIEYKPMPKRKLDPLPSAAFQILLSLAGDDLHGYGIMRQVEQQTEGRLRLGPGTLYSSLQALLEEGLIEEIDDPDDPVDARRRRHYRLTTTGRKLARSEADRLADLLRVARARKIFKGDYV
jgi:DNA-binding PadR family transcriptional regulator